MLTDIFLAIPSHLPVKHIFRCFVLLISFFPFSYFYQTLMHLPLFQAETLSTWLIANARLQFFFRSMSESELVAFCMLRKKFFEHTKTRFILHEWIEKLFLTWVMRRWMRVNIIKTQFASQMDENRGEMNSPEAFAPHQTFDVCYLERSSDLLSQLVLAPADSLLPRRRHCCYLSAELCLTLMEFLVIRPSDSWPVFHLEPSISHHCELRQ